jgi:hypothetical protein
LLPGDVAGVGLGEDADLTRRFSLARVLDVLWQQFVAEGFADVLGP